MTRHLRLGLVALAVGALLAPSAAYADTMRHGDPQHDVAKRYLDHAVRAPDNANADILRTVATHGKKSVTVKVKLAAVGRYWDVRARIVTPKTYFVADLSWGDFMYVHVTRHYVHDVSCDAATYDVNGKQDVITLTVPRSCLGNPKWVKVGTDMTSGIHAANRYVYYDLGLATGYQNAFPVGRKLHAG
jgi:hypothetical protein